MSGYPYSPAFSDGHRAYWSLFPLNLLTIGLQLLTQATESPKDPGISWSNRAKCLPKEPGCATTMHDVFILHVKTFFPWFILALYFDNIIPNISGVRKSKLYFLYPGYWTGNGGSRREETVASVQAHCHGYNLLHQMTKMFLKKKTLLNSKLRKVEIPTLQFKYAVLLRHILESQQVAAAVEKQLLRSIVSRYFIYGAYEDNNSSSNYVDGAVVIHHYKEIGDKLMSPSLSKDHYFSSRQLRVMASHLLNHDRRAYG
ncbi:hypothetical protein HAX54_012612 [Datura stramonium]|uniref:Uncharacterized protein n=1 Tax=Datura stramonium TaxID=4076 RepID=A0ABS8TLM0_DATST|nr:hypothetical protein [Datura stramonium]